MAGYLYRQLKRSGYTSFVLRTIGENLKRITHENKKRRKFASLLIKCYTETMTCLYYQQMGDMNSDESNKQNWVTISKIL